MYVQAKNPRSGLYIKIDRESGKIISRKRTRGRYKGIPLARHRKISSRVDPFRWSIKRRQPYTGIGIRRLKCIRCGAQAEYQWQICADGNNWRPICGPCDVLLNRTVLIFMRHPHAKQVASEYGEEK